MAKLNQMEVGQVVNALKTYAGTVSKFYAKKVVRALKVSPFYALKLGATYNRLAEV